MKNHKNVRGVSVQTSGTFRGGFSLIEVMAAVALIGLLAGVVALSVPRIMNTGKHARAKGDAQNYAKAIISFEMQYHRYPTTEEGLLILHQPPAGAMPFMEGKLKADPWGNPYVYVVPGPENAPYEILSYGADNAKGGEGPNADISNLDP